MSENYDQPDHLEPPIAILDQEFSNRDVLISTIKQYFHARNEVDSNGALSGLFFCHEKSAELARRFNIVFIMDCTYKTNRFGMPLLNIVGITATYNTFNAGFAFICNETEPMYVWALQSFELSYQAISCCDRSRTCIGGLLLPLFFRLQRICFAYGMSTKTFWQTQPRNLTTLATRMTIWMTGASLSTVLASKRLRTSGLSFKSNGGQSKTLWFSMCTILGSFTKKKIIRCWTDRVLHFGSTSTSRSEGNHFVIKRILES
ncbi:hypothetical protein BASA83_012183 [Batrachochytrium salamandrivorans]|nr:hypothetical protein BASA83_012183 [Batrachochytrium salamandrivorans]